MADMQLTLPKDQLLQELRDKVAEIDSTLYADEIAEFKDLISKVGSMPTLVKETIDWHKTVAKGLKDGSITITDAGNLKDAPPKPKKGHVRLTVNGYRQNWGEDVLKKELKRYEEAVVDAKKPLEASIKLLEMSTETEVVINTADYQALLSGQTFDAYGRRIRY